MSSRIIRIDGKSCARFNVTHMTSDWMRLALGDQPWVLLSVRHLLDGGGFLDHGRYVRYGRYGF